MITRSFKKCGISTAADGSEDFDVHLEGLENYEVQMDDSDIQLDENEDPFADLSDSDIEYEETSDHPSCSDEFSDESQNEED